LFDYQAQLVDGHGRLLEFGGDIGVMGVDDRMDAIQARGEGGAADRPLDLRDTLDEFIRAGVGAIARVFLGGVGEEAARDPTPHAVADERDLALLFSSVVEPDHIGVEHRRIGAEIALAVALLG